MVTSGDATGVPSRSSEVARLALDGAARDDAERAARRQRAPASGSKTTGSSPVAIFSAPSLATRAARRLAADLLGIVELATRSDRRSTRSRCASCRRRRRRSARPRATGRCRDSRRRSRRCWRTRSAPTTREQVAPSELVTLGENARAAASPALAALERALGVDGERGVVPQLEIGLRRRQLARAAAAR